MPLPPPAGGVRSASSCDPADLDHVYAAKHLNFKKFKNDQNEDKDVVVRGWVDKTSVPEQDRWIEDYSDHSLLYFEMQKV